MVYEYSGAGSLFFLNLAKANDLNEDSKESMKSETIQYLNPHAWKGRSSARWNDSLNSFFLVRSTQIKQSAL